jgi:hypothetical protein
MFNAELESAAITQRERSIALSTISSLLVVARVISFIKRNFLRHDKRIFRGQLLDIPSVVRLPCLVADVDFSVRR